MRSRVLQIAAVASLLAAGGCSLHTDVHVMPLMLAPSAIAHGSGVKHSYEIGDYTRGIQFAPLIEAKSNSYEDLINLGKCELAARRLDQARRHLRAALDLNPPRTLYAEAAWDLSQVEYLANDFAAAEEWARTADESGLRIKKWHIDYLASLAGTQVHKLGHGGTAKVPMAFGKPDIPRVQVELNGSAEATAVVDSGAVLSIISRELAEKLGVQSLGNFEGEFYGLLGEPIGVRFGLLKSVRIGKIVIENVPVAIMPDKSLKFVVSNREPFKMDLLLGTSFLREFRFELDARHKTATFTTLSAQSKVPAADQNLFFSGFRPVAQVAVNGKGWFLFLVDTGSEITFLNDDTMFTIDRASMPRFHSAVLQGLGGSQKHGQKIEKVELGVDKWGGMFDDLPIYESTSKESRGIVGQNFMKNFTVVVDFGTMRMELHR